MNNLAELKAWMSRTFWSSEQVASWVRQHFVERRHFQGGGVVDISNYTLTVPATGTAALLGEAQTFTGLKTFSAGLSFGSATLGAYSLGTWSPSVEAATLGTLSATYSIRTGRYTRIGDVVFFSFFVRLNTYSAGTASGETWISLPLTASSTNVTQLPFTVISNGINWPGTPIDTAGEVVPGTNIMRLYANQDNASRQYVGPGDLAAGDDIACTGFYFV